MQLAWMWMWMDADALDDAGWIWMVCVPSSSAFCEPEGGVLVLVSFSVGGVGEAELFLLANCSAEMRVLFCILKVYFRHQY